MSVSAPDRPTSPMPAISRSLQILAAVVLLLIVAVTMQQLLQLRSGVLDDTKRQLARLDMVFAEHTGRAMETVDLVMGTVIEALHESDQAGGAAPVAINDDLQRRIAGVREVTEIAVADPSGRILYSSRAAAAGNEMLPAAGLALLHHHATHATDAPQVSGPLRAADGHWTALLTRRLTNARGEFAGVVAAFLNLRYFEEFYKAVELNESGAITLHHRDGTVLASYPHRDDIVGSTYAALPPFKDVLAHAIAGTAMMDSPIDGSSRVVAIQALKLFPLAVSVSVSADQILAPWRRQSDVFLVSAVVACVVIGTLLLLLAQQSHKVETLLGEFRSARDAAESANVRLLEQMAERERTEAALRQAQRIEAVGQLTGGVAHDFNNLLTVVLGNIDLLQQSCAQESVTAERLERMRKAAERGATLTDQLLAFARRQPLVARAMKLNDVVQEMTGLLQSAAGGNIRIETLLADDPWLALVDPTQIELVILNLAINARDAMPTGGTLTVETANTHLGPPERPEDPPAGDYVMVRVGDTGTGMAPDVLAKAFEPFFTTKGPGRGSGLGLSQVFGLARQSGGGVRIESAPGLGTSVRVFLPRAAPAADEPPAGAAAAGPVGSASTVLLVDDDEAVRCTTGMILQTMGYTVLQTEGGEGALERLADDSEIDILLTDVAMPGMNGPELARRVRELRPAMPIVFFSGYADPEAVAGASIRQRIVRKPFRASELAAQIEAALAEHRTPA
ncbi:hybrid sensor histidine kinase/response regulator [Limobrevibacterium gyesilva]|uniref:histidine kinase n=1 Tax=Limobrevibacterium gyesilva TaxID=2991712 RepID=A0AA41YHW7_9PROT|nr:hybrid sensor histidine kinase/response regulator [Limobrevibacterium gyesilva]MCW3473744.1 response regulator [Limobrevibacterium gyesilva]